jgi:hypothetical protein
MYLFLFSLFITIIFWLFNLEKGNGMGNVWLRPNDKGEIIFAYKSLLKMLVEPFKNYNMWKPINWDINFYVILFLVYIITYSFSYLEKD